MKTRVAEEADKEKRLTTEKQTVTTHAALLSERDKSASDIMERSVSPLEKYSLKDCSQKSILHDALNSKSIEKLDVDEICERVE